MEQGTMALWDKPEFGRDARGACQRHAAAPAGTAPAPGPYTQDPASALKERIDMKESIIAAGLSIEGKINGNGHVRVAGKFKGDIQVEGNLHIDSGARVEGQVRAGEVIVSGELGGNIEGAKRVELQQGGTITGDVKAGSLTVAPGSRMRGAVDFGFDDRSAASGCRRPPPPCSGAVATSHDRLGALIHPGRCHAHLPTLPGHDPGKRQPSARGASITCASTRTRGLGGVAVTKTAWQIEGTLDAERMDAATEYSILVVVRNERNEELARQVINVGADAGCGAPHLLAVHRDLRPEARSHPADDTASAADAAAALQGLAPRPAARSCPRCPWSPSGTPDARAHTAAAQWPCPRHPAPIRSVNSGSTNLRRPIEARNSSSCGTAGW